MILFTVLWLSYPSLGAYAVEPVGSYNYGSLSKGLSLHQFFKRRSNLFEPVSPEAFQYGTDAMRDALEKLAKLSIVLTNQPLKVGDISKRRGGKIAQHVTHQTGLDVDVGYITKSPKKSGHRSKRFHNKFTEIFDRNHKAFPSFDALRNYKLLSAAGSELDISKVFVSCGILRKLKQLDNQLGGDLVSILSGHDLHNDHFHMRLRCPRNAKRCSEKWWSPKVASAKKKAKKRRTRSYSCSA